MHKKQLCVALLILTWASLLVVHAHAGDDEKRGLFDFGRDQDAATQPSARTQPTTRQAAPEPEFIHLEATIDGSDIVTITAKGVHWEHRSWDWPDDVRINNVAWDPQDRPDLPSKGVLRMLPDLDFSTARVVSRSGRDTVAMEHTEDGITVYFVDSPNGPARYTIRIKVMPKSKR